MVSVSEISLISGLCRSPEPRVENESITKSDATTATTTNLKDAPFGRFPRGIHASKLSNKPQTPHTHGPHQSIRLQPPLSGHPSSRDTPKATPGSRIPCLSFNNTVSKTAATLLRRRGALRRYGSESRICPTGNKKGG